MIEKIISENFDTETKFKKMFGDASSREYFRLTNNKGSYILVKDQPHAQQIIDFVIIDEVLPKEIKRPTIIKHSNQEGYLIQEDIGAQHLADQDLGKKRYFDEAILKILDYQKVDVDNFIYREKSFNQNKLKFESDISIKYFLNQHLNIECPKFYEKIYSAIFEKFQRNQVLCHRDYHSKNLMIHNEALYHIDFQDAMLGPSLYDLVSFVEDPYYAYEEKDKTNFKKIFFENESFYDSFDEYINDYNIIAFQRLFKAIGSYTFLNYEKGKSGYLPYIKPAFANLKSVGKQIDLKEFKELIAKIEEAL